jgi:hypothetical protein
MNYQFYKSFTIKNNYRFNKGILHTVILSLGILEHKGNTDSFSEKKRLKTLKYTKNRNPLAITVI